jgi:drug/metabolite transporter (DMT)-like permease
MTQINSSPANPQRRLGLISGVASGACYGGMSFLIHITLGKAPASEVAFLRAICAVVVLLPLIVRHGKQWLGRNSLLLWIRSGIGAISVLCFTWNLQHTSVGFANTLFNLAPIFVVLLGASWGQEKLTAARFVPIILVVLASTLFWHASRPEVNALVWVVGLGGMCAAAVAYSLLKTLPTFWSPFDITWCLNLATLPVALLFKHGLWIIPLGKVGLFLGAICTLGLIGNALANLSFRHLELSTATALVPSFIIWGVLLDISEHKFPAVQGIAGCVLYLAATIRLIIRPATSAPSGFSVAPVGLRD